VVQAAVADVVGPAVAAHGPDALLDEVVGRVYEHYQQLLAESNALDFDDLLMKAVHLFRNSPEALSAYQSRYQHLLVGLALDAEDMTFAAPSMSLW
jgi:DNA helicase-2/ATP-dependent DNA helicase PcrA